MKICAHTEAQIDRKRVVGRLNSNAFTANYLTKFMNYNTFRMGLRD